MKAGQSGPSLDQAAAVDGVSRRGFLKAGAALGGGLLISFSLPVLMRGAQAQEQAFAPNAYVRIDREGRVFLTIQPVEMGQGTYTSMPALIAEELEVGLDQVVIEHAPADDKRYANPMLKFQVTGGSTSVPGNWKPLREAGAAARILLVTAAAKQWGVPVDHCSAERGKVVHAGSGRQLGYGELVDAAAQLPFPTTLPLKSPSEFKLIGTPAKRTDSPGKVNGTAVFGIDVRPEGLKVAAVMLSPVKRHAGQRRSRTGAGREECASSAAHREFGGSGGRSHGSRAQGAGGVADQMEARGQRQSLQRHAAGQHQDRLTGHGRRGA